MNERIKECWINAAREDSNDKWDTQEEFIERFALLIVRECTNIIENNNPRPPGTQIMYSLLQDEYFDTGWQVAVETKAHQIKKHFGVEE